MIREVDYNEVLKIRQEVMYPDKDLKFVRLPEDDLGIHMGFYDNGKPISILSLFLKDNELQFRKFATLTELQGKGYGTKLIEWLLDYAKDMQFERVWCNSRLDKKDFYQKFDFSEQGDTFEKNGIQYIIMEKKFNLQ